MDHLKHKMNQFFFEMFGNMIGGGVPLVRALKCFEQDCPNVEYRELVGIMRNEIVNGKNFVDCLEDFELCESVMAILKAGISQGELDYACLKVGKVLRAHESMVEVCLQQV